MRFIDLLATSLASLRQRPFRTSLTVLGVIIGTTAVVVMVSLGIGMTQSYTQSIDGNPTLRQVTIYSVPQDAAAMGLPTQVDDALVKYLSVYADVRAAWPTYNFEAMAHVDGQSQSFYITAMPREAILARALDLAWGQVPDGSAALLLGDQIPLNFYDEATGTMADIDFQTSTLFLDFDTSGSYGPEPNPGGQGDGGPDDPQPSAPKPKKVIMPVAGVVAADPNAQYSADSYLQLVELQPMIDVLKKAMPGKALPNQPATSDGRPKPGFIYSQITLDTEGPEAAERLMLALRADGWDAQSDIEWIRQAQQQAFLIQAVFGGIGFISLFVAAIGIANTMMMSVYERTKEIGVMKVMGAALGDIRKMFLFESAAIGFVGGLLGLALSFAVAALINSVVGSSMEASGGANNISVIPLWLILAALAFATGIGTLAGMVPAIRASRLSPLAAIRTS